MNDPETTRYLESRFATHTRESLIANVEMHAADPASLFLAIVLREGDRHIGNVKLGPIDERHGTADVGILLGEPDCRGQGYASEAIAQLTALAIGELGLRKLTAGCYAANAASALVFERAGWRREAVRPAQFVLDGEPVDEVLMGLVTGASARAPGDLVSAYDGVDDLAGFDAVELTAYRELALAATQEQADFVSARLPAQARVVDLGCGNGRLLMKLAARGAVAEGIGIDISRTRIEFASAWASTAGAGDLEFRRGDVLEEPLPDAVDAVVCVAGTFAYFDAMAEGAGARVLAKARTALRPGGLLVLEVYPYSYVRRAADADEEQRIRRWRELPEGDPWRYYLSDMRIDPQSKVLEHGKVFVHRSTGAIDAGRREYLRLYDADELEALLAEAGFSDIELFSTWSGEQADPERESLIVLAR